MELLTVRETAEILRISEITVRRHIAAGLLEAVRVGRSVRVTQESLDRALQPIQVKDKAQRKFVKGEPLEEDDPLFSIIGIGSSEGTGDGSTNKHKYLAEAYADLHDQ